MSSIKDVATAAGVSVMTVSRVLNAPDKVRPETRAAVQEAMARLAYAPNLVAKALVENRLRIIGVYIPTSIELLNNFAMQYFAGIGDVLSQHMYSLLLLREFRPDHIPQCDGYLVLGLSGEQWQTLEDVAARRGAILASYGPARLEGVSTVGVDDVRGEREMIEYLLKLGHRSIVLINRDGVTDYTVDRQEGYRQALANAGLPWDSKLVYRADNSPDGGREALRRALREHPDATAAACVTDVLAVGAMHAAREAGLRIPEQFSIAGYDGTGYQFMTEPHITTVEQPVYRIGQELAEMIIRRFGTPDAAPEHMLLPTRVLPGGSCGPARANCLHLHEKEDPS